MSNPPESLERDVEAAIQAIDPEVVVVHASPTVVEAVRPGGKGRGSLWNTAIRVEVAWSTARDEAHITIRSDVERKKWARGFDSLRFDLGRSIENVEEFQLALRRRVEGHGGRGD